MPGIGVLVTDDTVGSFTIGYSEEWFGRVAPAKTNMFAENQWLEMVGTCIFPIGIIGHVSFRGCIYRNLKYGWFEYPVSMANFDVVWYGGAGRLRKTILVCDRLT